ETSEVRLFFYFVFIFISEYSLRVAALLSRAGRSLGAAEARHFADASCGRSAGCDHCVTI
ncbi:hypothetical protein, partial [uncultured Alistipes sp.]